MSASKLFEIAFELGGRISPEMRQAFDEARNMMGDFEGGANISNKAMKVMAVGAVAASAAIAGIAAGLGTAVKAASDFSDSMAQVQASTGANTEEIEGMKEITKNLYTQNLGEDWNDLATAISTTKSVTQLTGDELENATANAIAYRDVFGQDISESIKTSDTMMKNFGISSSQAYNLLAQGAQQGLNKSDELLDSANEYAPYFSQLGFSANDMFSTFNTGLKNGAFNLDKVGDAVKEFNIRSKDGSKSTMAAYAALGLEGNKLTQTFAKGGPEAQKAFTKVVNAIGNVKDPAEQSALAVSLFGTQAEDLEMNVITSLGTVKNQFDMTKKTMEEVKNVKYNTLSGAIKGIGRTLLVELVLPIGEKLLPAFQSMANYLNENLPGIKNKLSNLFGNIDTSQITNISSTFTPLISQVGGVFSSIGQIFKDFWSKNGDSIISGFKTVASVYGSIVGGIAIVIKSLIPIIQPIFTKIVTFVMGIVSQVADFWNENGAQIIQAVQNVFGGIAAIIKFLSPVILFIINMVWGNIKGVIQGSLKVIMGVVKIFAGLFTGDFGKMWEGVKQVFTGAVSLIWNLVNLMFYGKILGGIKVLASKGIGLIGKMWSGIKSFFTQGVRSAWSKVNSLGPKISEGFTTAKNSAEHLAKSMWNGVKKWFDKIVSGAKALPGKIGDGIKSMASKAAAGVKSMGNTMLKNIGHMVNGVIDGITYIMGKLGIDTKLPTWNVPQYAQGTKGHPGGLAILGDGGGPELFRTPNGQVGLSPGTDTMMNLPRGTEVIPAAQTAQILQQYDIPAYAEGTGVTDALKSGASWVTDKVSNAYNAASDKVSDIWSSVSDPSALFNIIAKKFGVVAEGTGNTLKIAKGALTTIKESAISYLKDKTANLFSADFSGNGSESAKKWILQAMAITGTPTSYLNALMTISQKESGFNPSAINLWDSNAKAGHPSQGLFQTIPTTFAAYRNKSLPNDITNPISNAVAAINYMNSRYGGISNVPGIKAMSSGSGYVGYRKGGTITSDDPFKMNEAGGELMQLPIGSRIFTHSKSKDLIEQAATYGKTGTNNVSASNDKYEINLSPQYVFQGDTSDTSKLKKILSNANDELKALIIQVLKDLENKNNDVSFE